MKRFSTGTLEKVGFVLSALFVAFLYGYGARSFNIFPSPLIDRAWDQAEQVLPFLHSPHYLEPRVYERSGARSVRPEEMAPGLTLITTRLPESDWRPGIQLIDAEGNVVHRWVVEPNEVFSGVELPEGRLPNPNIHGSHLRPDGDVVLNLSTWGVARLDACGEVQWARAMAHHHSVARADDGSYWVPTQSQPSDDEVPTGSFTGLGEPEYQNAIVRLDDDGKTLDHFNVLKVLYENELEERIAKTRMVSHRSDITHLNDVEPLPKTLADQYPTFAAGDLLVSLSKLDMVFVMDPETKTVKWHAVRPWISQHDPDFIGAGWIGVFDNRSDGTGRGEMLGGSRIVAVQPHTDSLDVRFPTRHSEPFYTRTQGKWQLLSNGNMLLAESNAGRVVEVNRNGETVWDWVTEPYDSTSVPEVTEATRYDLNETDVATWRCSIADKEEAGQ